MNIKNKIEARMSGRCHCTFVKQAPAMHWCLLRNFASMQITFAEQGIRIPIFEQNKSKFLPLGHCLRTVGAKRSTSRHPERKKYLRNNVTLRSRNPRSVINNPYFSFRGKCSLCASRYMKGFSGIGTREKCTILLLLIENTVN